MSWTTIAWSTTASASVMLALMFCFIWLAQNVTKRKRAEDRLRESEARFRTVADVAPALIWMADVNKRCTFLNKPWTDFTGRALEEDLGDGWSQCVHPDDRERCLKTYMTAFDARQNFVMEYRLRRHDDAYRWILDHGTPLYDSQRVFAGYIGSCIDVTERRMADMKFRLAVEASPNAIVMVDEHGTIVLVNEQTERHFGYGRDELVGASIEMLLPERYRDAHPMHPKNLKAAGAALAAGADRDMFARRKDGTELPVEVSLNPIHTDEGDFVLAVIIDVSARRTSEREVSRLREDLFHIGRVTTMGQLASALAHEINQPLGAILRNAEAAELLLQSNSPDLEELRAIVSDIRKDDQRAGGVIDRLRGFLKRHDIEKYPVNVREVIEDVAALTRVDAAARHVGLEIDASSNLPFVNGDRIHLQQVLLNLLMNAIDAASASAHPQRVVTVRAGCVDPQVVEISVIDRGNGIAPEQAARIFEPFFTTKSQGMGMGLPIARTIVEAHGGRIWAENNSTGGAAFRFTLSAVTGGLGT